MLWDIQDNSIRWQCVSFRSVLGDILYIPLIPYIIKIINQAEPRTTQVLFINVLLVNIFVGSLVGAVSLR